MKNVKKSTKLRKKYRSEDKKCYDFTDRQTDRRSVAALNFMLVFRKTLEV